MRARQIMVLLTLVGAVPFGLAALPQAGPRAAPPGPLRLMVWESWSAVPPVGSSTPSVPLLQSLAAPAAPLLVQVPAPLIVAPGDSAFFSVVAEGEGLQYQWARDGATIHGATQPHLQLVHVTTADDGARFSVRVRNDSGEVTTTMVQLFVQATPVGMSWR